MLLRTILVMGLLCGCVCAQEPQQTRPKEAKPDAKSEQKDKASGAPQEGNGTSNDRLFYALPNFLTLENAGKVPPLSTGEKFKVVARGSFDPVQFPWWAFLSGIGQAENSEPGYGQGAAGYGKRYGATAADGIIENFMTSSVFPALLKQDPRYFQSGKGGIWRRTGYALSRILVTRGDSGNTQVNYSEIFGSALSAGISTYSYHPHADQTLANTGKVWASQVGYDGLTFVVKEFWPDIRRKLRRQKGSEPAAN